MAKEEILAAIRRAAEVLGRAPSRGELRRITGISHYRVLAEFATLREAIRKAGLKPNPKGERIATEELLEDWRRVEKKLGRRPSRAEYVREGKFSAGAFVARFGNWGSIEEKALTTKDAKEHKVAEGPGRRKGKVKAGRELARIHDGGGDKALAFECGMQLAQLPEPLVGKRKVTELVVAVIVKVLLGDNTQWPAFSAQTDIRYGDTAENPFTAEDRREAIESGLVLAPRGIGRNSDLGFAARGVDKGRAVMGEPFDRSPMTNAPVNELGVVLLFGMVAADLGFQVEALWGRFPDCEAKRRVAKGKWQQSRIEFEYESKNFHLHGHDPKGCDVIVCWRHNWKGCPEELEVIELSRLVGRSGDLLSE
jgi:hypothetical protein